MRDDELVFRVEVDQNGLDFTAVVAVDEARRIDDGDAMLDRKATARQDEARIALGDCHGNAARDGLALERLQHGIFGRAQIEPGIAHVSVSRHVERLVKTLDGYGYCLLHG